MKPYGIVYKITNLINNKVYIGQTTYSLEKRWLEHLYTNPTRKYLLHKAMDKYGRENFKIEQIGIAESENHLDLIEKDFITKENSMSPNGYNLESGGNKFKTLSAETKQKIKNSNTGFNCRQPHMMRVTCLEIATGIEKSYPNVGSTKKDGFCPVSIKNAIDGKSYSSGGYRWKLANSENYPNYTGVRSPKTLPMKPVVGTSLNGEEVVYYNKKDIYETGFDLSKIIKCCEKKKKSKSHKKYTWRYL